METVSLWNGAKRGGRTQMADVFELKPADLILTRNAGGEEANTSPGRWNHAAVAISTTEIVEAQAHVNGGTWTDNPEDPGCVIRSDWSEFRERYPELCVRRMGSLLPSERDEIICEARAMVGTEYRAGASVFYRRARRRRWLNCVALCRFAYWDALDSDPGWRLPDDIANDRRLETVWEKKP